MRKYMPEKIAIKYFRQYWKISVLLSRKHMQGGI